MIIIELLVNTLGSEPAWQELWSKLQTTLSQIRYNVLCTHESDKTSLQNASEGV